MLTEEPIYQGGYIFLEIFITKIKSNQVERNASKVEFKINAEFE